jgi:hypothetical protein
VPGARSTALTFIINIKPPPPRPPCAAGTCLTSILAWGMCGGRSSPFGEDAPVDGWCCSQGFSCARINAWYYQCQPQTSAAVLAPAPPVAGSTDPRASPPPPGIRAGAAAASERGEEQCCPSVHGRLLLA